MRSLMLVLISGVLLSTGCATATYPAGPRALGDAQLIARIKTALLNAPEIDATKIDVRAADGAVTLEGLVPSDDHARKVIDLVRQVPGVTDVESKISVAGKPSAISRGLRRPTARS